VPRCVEYSHLLDFAPDTAWFDCRPLLPGIVGLFQPLHQGEADGVRRLVSCPTPCLRGIITQVTTVADGTLHAGDV
jgi:hypothetical protein